MNTTMSTKRTFVAPRRESMSGTGISVIGLVAGLALMALGVGLDNSLPAAVGFVSFATSFMYLNGMFWAKLYDSKKISVSQSRINRYF